MQKQVISYVIICIFNLTQSSTLNSI